MGNSATTGSTCAALLGKTHDPGFVWKIHGFSVLTKRGAVTIRSAVFDCSGYKWYLIVCPFEKKSCAITPYVALSLGLSLGSLDLDPDFTMVVVYQLSIYNHADGMYRRCKASYTFQNKYTQSDVECLIPLKKLMRSSDFLVDDCCVFGVEILKVDIWSHVKKAVVYPKMATTVQNLFIQKNGFITGTYNLGVTILLESNTTDYTCSPTVEFDGCKWYFCVYPHGDRYSTNCLSLYLCMDASDELHRESGRAVELRLSIGDQKHGKHFTKRIPGLVVFAGRHRWGCSDFIPLETLRDPSRGYLVGSCCVIQADITILGSSNDG